MKTCSSALRTSAWGEGSPSNRTTTLSTQPRQGRSGFKTSLWMFLWPSQSPDLNPIYHLWRDLQQRSSSNPTEFERICREKWEKLPKYRCAKHVVSYPRRLEAVIAAEGNSTKYWVKGLNNYVIVILYYINRFLLQHYGVLCVDWRGGKNYFKHFTIRL